MTCKPTHVTPPGAFASKMGSLRAPRTAGRSRPNFLDSYEDPHGRSGRSGVLKTATLDNRRLSPSYAAHGRNGSVTEQDLAVTTAQDPRKAALYVFGEKSQLRVSLQSCYSTLAFFFSLSHENSFVWAHQSYWLLTASK